MVWTIRMPRNVTTGQHATNDNQRLKAHRHSSLEGHSFLDVSSPIGEGLDDLLTQRSIYMTMAKSLFCRSANPIQRASGWPNRRPDDLGSAYPGGIHRSAALHWRLWGVRIVYERSVVAKKTIGERGVHSQVRKNGSNETT